MKNNLKSNRKKHSEYSDYVAILQDIDAEVRQDKQGGVPLACFHHASIYRKRSAISPCDWIPHEKKVKKLKKINVNTIDTARNVSYGEIVCCHILAIVGKYVDDVFQAAISKFVVTSFSDEILYQRATVKSVSRMLNKSSSVLDNFVRHPPRSAHNLDVIRCALTFSSISSMQDAFKQIN